MRAHDSTVCVYFQIGTTPTTCTERNERALGMESGRDPNMMVYRDQMLLYHENDAAVCDNSIAVGAERVLRTTPPFFPCVTWRDGKQDLGAS